MAIAISYLAIDMSNEEVWFGTLTEADADHLTVTNGVLTATYYGSFTYDAFGTPAGTITGMEQFVGTTQAFEVTGLALDAVYLSGFFSVPEFEAAAFSGADSFQGSAFNDTLMSFDGNDTINGGGGFDYLEGGRGNDLYIVNGGDTVFESASEGADTVQSSASFTLGTNVENLTLTGSAAINGTGNSLANILKGNGAANILDGFGGTDRMEGGTGNDTYKTNGGDRIVENANSGIDSVQSSVTLTLGANLENLTLTGGSAVDATGNSLANVLKGNGSDNLLNGAGGADRMEGGLGNDTYLVNGSDTVVEAAGAGTDTVQSSVTYALTANVENLTLTGTATSNATGNNLGNVLRGNGSANTIFAGTGADVITGGLGKDQLFAGVDKVRDEFVFNSVGDTGVGAARDSVYDFVSGTDDIRLSSIDANSFSGGNQSFTFSGTTASAFGVWYAVLGTGVVVRGDVNGDGVRDFEIQVVGVTSLQASDFLL